ncbi:MAG: hypothetical protein M3N52_11060 [Actinomycetota bacterium]|nr:hypothetical protein [Actinomycetota bacterium]
MTTRTLFRLSALALVVSAVAVTGGRVLHPALDRAGLTSAAWAPAHWLWLVGLLAGMIGTIGLYLRQHQRLGLLGFFGVATAWIGMGLMSGAVYFEAVIEPGLIDHTPQLVDAFVRYEGLGAFLPVFLTSAIAFGVGFVLFGIAMFRAGLLPKWAIALVTVGAAIGGPQGLLPPVVAYSAFLALGAGLIGLAYGLWRSVEEEPGRMPRLTRRDHRGDQVTAGRRGAEPLQV